MAEQMGIVAMRPRALGAAKASARAVELSLLFPCPSCKAKAGEGCRWGDGTRKRDPHEARVGLVLHSIVQWFDAAKVAAMFRGDLPGALRMLAAHVELEQLAVKADVTVAGGLRGDAVRLVVTVMERK